MRYKNYIAFCMISLFLCLTGCKTFNCVSPQLGTIKDLEVFPQDLQVYSSVLPQDPLITKDRMLDEYALFKKHFFQPWSKDKASVPASTAYSIFDRPNTKENIRWWAENLLPWTDIHWDEVKKNAAISTYPSRKDKGILIQRTSVYAAPTQSSFFLNPQTAGEGFPFNYLIESNLHAGTPVFITHTSTNGDWVFIETDLVSGWVPEHTVALISDNISKWFSSLPQAAIIHDNVALNGRSGRHVTTGYLGTVLPIIKSTPTELVLLAPLRDQHRRARITEVYVSKIHTTIIPHKLTASFIADIGNPLLGQLYGWGGSFGHRDCSELMKDLFIPFGIWLPRNSQAQIHAWNYIDTTQLLEDEVYQLMKDKAIPFATLIGFKGHIGLYLGMYNNTPAMLHDVWGIRTIQSGSEGRHILGRIVITSLKPGAELCITDSLLFDKRTGISVLN